MDNRTRCLRLRRRCRRCRREKIRAKTARRTRQTKPVAFTEKQCKERRKKEERKKEKRDFYCAPSPTLSKDFWPPPDMQNMKFLVFYFTSNRHGQIFTIHHGVHGSVRYNYHNRIYTSGPAKSPGGDDRTDGSIGRYMRHARSRGGGGWIHLVGFGLIWSASAGADTGRPDLHQ